jgi:ferritin
MIIPSNILDLLQNQYKHETSNSLRYFVRSSWAKYRGFEGAGKFFAKEAEGERGHADKVKQFIEDRNEALQPSPYTYNDPDNFTSFNELFETAFVFEQETTDLLQNIYTEAFKAGDIMTVVWVQELIKEQIEEENLYRTILDRIASRGKDAASDCDNDLFIGEL